MDNIIIRIPTNVMVASAEFLYNIMPKLTELTGQEMAVITDLNLTTTFTSKGLNAKMDPIEGLTIEMHPVLFAMVMSVYSDVTMSLLDAAIAVKNACVCADKRMETISAEWCTEEVTD